MRRTALQFALRLPGTSSSATAAAAPSVCGSVACLIGVSSAAAAAVGVQSSSSSGGGAVAAAAAAALAPWRPFSASSTVDMQQRGPYHSRQQRQAVDPGSPLGLLAACKSVQEMRSWQDVLQAGGRFGARELAGAIRAVGQRQDLPHQDRQEYLFELLAAGADGGVKLDGKSAAYLLWGPSKCGLSGKDPAVQRIVPIAFQYLDDMKSNEISTCIWAMGILGIVPSESVQAQLLSRLVPMLPEMNVKELTAVGVGITRLGLQDVVGVALVDAFESQLGSLSALPLNRIGLMVKMMACLPGMRPDSQFAITVFTRALRSAPRLSLSTLCETVWAAGRIQYRYSDSDLQRMLGVVEQKLADNYGMHVQTLLHGLAYLDCHSNDTGPLTHSFLEQCVESQLKAACNAGGDKKLVKHLTKLVLSLGLLQARIADHLLQCILDALQEAGLEHVVQPQRLQVAFRQLRFQPGVDALEDLAKRDKGKMMAWKQGRHRKRQRQAGESHELEGAAAAAAALAPATMTKAE